MVGWMMAAGVAHAQSYCIPNTANYCCNYGIVAVTLPNLYQESSNASVGYEDYSASVAEAQEGEPLFVAVQTDGSEPHDVRIWLDVNNDGTFSHPSELVFEALGSTDPSGQLSLPAGTPFNTNLRLRVMADFAGSNPQPCQAPDKGQAEDYSFQWHPGTQAPVANFSAASTYTCNGIVYFTQEATGNPSSYLWNFGDGQTSTEANPSHQYQNDGTYSVSLTVANSQGSDTFTRPDYIEANIYPTCDTFSVPANNTVAILYTNTYVLTDDGGPNGNYSINTNGSLALSTVGAEYVCLRFLSFNFEYPFDYLEIFDGPTPAAPLLGKYSGTVLPPDFCSSGSSLCVRQVSDDGVTYSGFVALAINEMGIKENGLPEWAVYPNPFINHFYVVLPPALSGEFTLRLSNATGQTVWQQKYTEPSTKPIEITATEIPAGLYVLSVNGRYGNWQQKVLKTR